MADGTMTDGFYVNARGGPNFSANEGSQTKISRYIPDTAGRFRLKWRTGREAMQRLAEPGEIYGAIHIRRPINGLLSIVDQSRCGILLYTEDGLYVDTIFPDGRRFTPAMAGVYPQPGEFFAGSIYPDQQSGKIYFAMGKYTPMLFEAQGWSLKENPVRALETVQKTVDITAAQIASPPEIALSVRGGPGAAHVARFAPALGGARLDGSMAGWESCEPVAFSADKEQTVEVRCLYDPDHLYLRWHARLGVKFEPKPLQPADRIFTHDRLADTLSFYFQGDPSAKLRPRRRPRGRCANCLRPLQRQRQDCPGIALGMYPEIPRRSGKPVAADLRHARRQGLVRARRRPGQSRDGLPKVDEDGKAVCVISAAIPVDARCSASTTPSPATRSARWPISPPPSPATTNSGGPTATGRPAARRMTSPPKPVSIPAHGPPPNSRASGAASSSATGSSAAPSAAPAPRNSRLILATRRKMPSAPSANPPSIRRTTARSIWRPCTRETATAGRYWAVPHGNPLEARDDRRPRHPDHPRPLRADVVWGGVDLRAGGD